MLASLAERPAKSVKRDPDKVRRLLSPSPSQIAGDDIRNVDELEQHLTDAEAKPDAASSTLTDPRPDAPKDKA